jgi:acyl-CoA reductase-like NAD-dependent aldehyde dehydrogenase
MNSAAVEMAFDIEPSMTIGGLAVPGTRSIAVVDPATGAVFAHAPDATLAETDAAVAAAKSAFPAWSRLAWDARVAAVMAFSAAIREEIQDLGALLCREQGKPLERAIGEINSALFFMEAYAKMTLPPQILRDAANQHVTLYRRPIGVVGAITAWNYPLLLALWKIAPALIAGNTVVVKPAPTTPLATLALGPIAARTLPAGVLNLLSGGVESGVRLTQHPDVGKISFTGSTETGRRIMSSAGTTLKHLTMELGGNDAGIVLADADPRKIANDIFWAMFSNCGQVCAGLKRLYVHRGIHDQLCEALVEIAKTVKIGGGFTPGVQLGPLQNLAQKNLLAKMVDRSVELGARVLYRGPVPDTGYFYPITLLTDVPAAAPVIQDEAFGPVLSIIAYDDVQDALAAANASQHGLGGSVWSADIARATELAAALEVGTSWVNQHPSMHPDFPFGGVKASGIGVEGGHWGLEEFTNIHVVNVAK